jgi:hypothetical protein
VSELKELREEFKTISQSLRELNFRMDALIDTQLKSIQTTNQLLQKISEHTDFLCEFAEHSTDLSQVEEKLESVVEGLSSIKESVDNIELL